MLLWDAFDAERAADVGPALQPIFQQYANLYPVMDGILDLSDYDSVVRAPRPAAARVRAGPSDPNSMPVTRDLSRAKRAAILRWLRSPGRTASRCAASPPPAPAARRRR